MSAPKRVSQPALTGVGEQTRTRLITVLDTLKSLGSPTRLEDLQILLNINDLHPGTALFEMFKNHERVIFDPKTSLWSWKPEYELKSASDVHRVVRAHHARGGMQFKTLRESWPTVQPVVEQLEADGKVYVQRGNASAGREGQLKVVYWNEFENFKSVDDEFRDTWRGIITPSAEELGPAMRAAGLSSANNDTKEKTPIETNQTKKKRKPAQRKYRITNTHLAGTLDITNEILNNSKK